MTAAPHPEPISPDLAATLGYVPLRAQPALSLVHRLTTPETPETVRLQEAAAEARELHRRCDEADGLAPARGILTGISIMFGCYGLAALGLSLVPWVMP